LTTIPPTPAADSGNGEEAVMSPFKNSDDYFAFEQMDKSKQSSAAEDLLQL
jgi:hypothetical protein